MAEQRQEGRFLTTWSGDLRKSFRILPTTQSGNEDLLAFINGNEGDRREDVHARLPYDQSRARPPVAPATAAADDVDDDTARPNPKRYREQRQVFENCGLLREATAAASASRNSAGR